MYNEIQVQEQPQSQFILSKLTSSNEITHSLVFQHLSLNTIALARRRNIEISQLVQDKLKKVVSISIDSKVVTIVKIHSDVLNNDYIVYLTEEFDVCFVYIDNEFNIHQAAKIRIPSQGYKQSRNFTPSIFLQGSEKLHCILIHAFEDVLFSLNLSELRNFLVTQIGGYKKRRKKDPKITVIKCGLALSQIVPLLDTNESFAAVTYKQSTYSLHFLEIKQGEIKITQNFGQLEQAPSLLIPVYGGVLAFTNASIFYFHPRKTQVDVATDKSVHINRQQNYVVKSTIKEVQYTEIFISSTKIDKTRILLVSETGKLYKLTFDIQNRNGKSDYIKEFNIIAMGYLTIPNPRGLHNISGDIYFQSSQLSKSVFFEISQDTYKVKYTVDSNPPILDVEPCLDQGGNLELFVNHGGVNTSELRKYRSSSYIVETTIEKSFPGFQLCNIKSMGHLAIIYSIDKKYFILDLNTLDEIVPSFKIPKEFECLDFYIEDEFQCFVGQNSLKINEKTVKTDRIVKSWIDEKSHMVIIITQNLNVHIFYYDQYRIVFNCGLTSYDVEIDATPISEDEFLISLSSWQEGYKVYKLKNANVTLLVDIKETTDVFASAIVSSNHDQFTFIQSMQDGSIQQVQFSNTGEIYNSYKFHSGVKSLPYFITKSENTIILFNSKEILLLSRDSTSRMFNYSAYPSSHPIIDVKITSKHQAIVIFQNGDISKFNFKLRNSRTSITDQPHDFPNIHKCIDIPNSRYLIGLFRETNSICLVVKNSFNIISKHSKSEFTIVDICYFPTEEGGHFLALLESENPIHVFCVRENNIILLKKLTIENLPSELSRIDNYDKSNSKFICVGENQVSLFHINQNTLEPDACENILIPHAISGYGCLAGKLYLGDILDGIIPVHDEDQDYLDRMDGKYQYLTSMTSVCTGIREYLIIGDAMGNCSTIESTSTGLKVITAFNIAQPISIIKSVPNTGNILDKMVVIGTSSGEVYLLSELNEALTEKAAASCQEELMFFSKHIFSEWITTFDNTNSKSKSELVLDDEVITKMLEYFQGDQTNSRKSCEVRGLLELIHLESSL